MFAVLGFHGGRLESHDITTSECLRDGQTNKLLSSEYVRHDSCLEFFTAKIEHGRKADDFATKETYLSDEVLSSCEHSK